MVYIFYQLIFSFFIMSLFMLSKKLLSLLMLEGCMICMVFFSLLYFGSSVASMFSGMIFSVFMVLDSVMGISILLSCTRSSTPQNSIITDF